MRLARAILAAVVALLIALGLGVVAVQSATVLTAEPVPTCTYPTGTISTAKALAYDRCMHERTQALVRNGYEPSAPTTVTVTETVTSSPTPVPTPTPTEPPPTEEPASPAGTFPTRTSVGPAVEPTAAYEGDCYFGSGESGTVVENRILNCDSAGGVRFSVDASNIAFRNSVIRGQMFTVGNTPGDASAENTTRAPVFTVEDSRIVQSSTVDWQDRAACCAHYVIKRSLIQGTHSGLAAHNNVTLVGNYITTDGTDSHSSGVRVLKNTVLRGNTIICKPVTPGYDGGCSAAGVFYSERLDGTSAAAFNLTIEGNYFKRGVTSSGAAGGPWFATRFINCANRTDCTGITFTGNQLDVGWGTDGGEFPFYSTNTWANNRWTDGQPALSNTSR